ncbi:MAG: phage tail sheath subtilisin-like domain-containing protein [Chloroflexota bacterium]|nr:phage tail sheath subtilisin-like domain-containing protein [Chloroflexota bacterium]
MPNYLSPGVYMEEVDRGTKPIESVGTAVAAFIGYTERASDTRNGETTSIVGKPTLVTNWSQYVAKFGGFVPGAYLPDSVYGYFANGGSICYVVSLRTLGTSDDPALTIPAKTAILAEGDKNFKVLEFSAKEGGLIGNSIEVEVKPAAPGAAPTEGEGDAKKTAAPAANEFTINVKVGGQVRESFPGLTTAKGDKNVVTVLQAQSEWIMASLFGKGDLAPAAGTYTMAGGKVKTKEISLKDYRGSVSERRGLGGLEAFDDVTMICAPDLMASYQAGEIDMKGVQAVQQSLIDYCELVRYCFAILDAPPAMMPQDIKEWRMQVNYDTTRAALYYPWIEVADMTGGKGRTRMVPPSGHMAGIYARVDSTRGVHKAPGNEIIRTALGLEVQVTKGEHDLLNPIGVNVIRSFPGRGIRIWGARTLSSDAAWRYINVRRLFNMIEESIERGTQWVVFEPNDQFLWGRVRRDVRAYLTTVWRSGALFGTTPDDAFYVKCDSETNPPDLRDLGQLVTEIGISPVKPAEFVIFRVSQWTPES